MLLPLLKNSDLSIFPFICCYLLPKVFSSIKRKKKASKRTPFFFQFFFFFFEPSPSQFSSYCSCQKNICKTNIFIPFRNLSPSRYNSRLRHPVKIVWLMSREEVMFGGCYSIWNLEPCFMYLLALCPCMVAMRRSRQHLNRGLCLQPLFVNWSSKS